MADMNEFKKLLYWSLTAL